MCLLRSFLKGSLRFLRGLFISRGVIIMGIDREVRFSIRRGFLIRFDNSRVKVSRAIW